MEIKTLTLGNLNTNCYILTKEKEQIIIDPASNFNEIKKHITKDIAGVIITHYHPDHTGALFNIKKEYNPKIYDIRNLKEGKTKIGIFDVEVIHTKGHTSDSLSILIDNNLFCGDFIFKEAIGRTDLGGNNKEMKESIEKILTYNKDIKIYPGHGDKTTLKDEEETLKYFKNTLVL